MNHILPLFGRLLLVPFFVNTAIINILNPQYNVNYLGSMGFNNATEVVLYGAIAALLLGSLSLLLGYKTRVGIFILLLFIIPTTLLFHWDFSGPIQTTNFFANVAIIGGLLALMGYGPGGFSLDARKELGVRK